MQNFVFAPIAPCARCIWNRLGVSLETPTDLVRFDAFVQPAWRPLAVQTCVEPRSARNKKSYKNFLFFSSCFRSFLFGCLSASDHVSVFPWPPLCFVVFSILFYMFFLFLASVGVGVERAPVRHACTRNAFSPLLLYVSIRLKFFFP